MSFRPPRVSVAHKITVSVRRETWNEQPTAPLAIIRHQQPAGRSLYPRFRTTAIALILLVGAVGGGATVWQTKFGQANKEALQSQVLGASTDQSSAAADHITPKSPIMPLSFDQSDLTIVADILPILIEQNRHEPTPEEDKDKQRRDALRNYLAGKGSPLAKDEAALTALLEAKNMKMMLAISFVEGNFCRHQLYYNCSGIGGSSKFRHYDGFAGWIADFDSLLERRYKGLAVEDFIGYYVQPGSQAWVNGVYQVLGELKAGNIE